MESLLRKLIVILFFFYGGTAIAETTIKLSPGLGVASVSNIEGYKHTSYTRVDGSFHYTPQLALNIFFANFANFETDGGAIPASLSLSGIGFGVIGLWPISHQAQPFIRVDYFDWSSEAYSLGKTVGKDSGFSAGLALGVHFALGYPGQNFPSLKVEILRYNDVSGADIDQFSLAVIFEF